MSSSHLACLWHWGHKPSHCQSRKRWCCLPQSDWILSELLFWIPKPGCHFALIAGMKIPSTNGQPKVVTHETTMTNKTNQPNKQINHKRHEHQKWHIEPKTNHEIYTMRYNWYNQEGIKNYGAKELSHSQEAPGICAEVHLRNMLWETEKRSKQKRHSLKIRCYCYELLLIAHIYSYLIFSNILITPPKEVMGVWFRVSSFQLGGKTKPLLKVYKK